MYKSQFWKIALYDWFCGPGSHIILFTCILDSGLRKERRRKKKITNIISFDDDLDVGAEDEDEAGEDIVRSLRKSTVGHVSSEEALDPPDSISPVHNRLTEPGIVSWAETPPQNGVLPDTKSIDNEEEEEDDIYGKSRPEPPEEDSGNGEQWVYLTFCFICCVKGIVHPNMKILSFIYSPTSSSKPLWMSLFCWTQMKIFWRRWETEQFWGSSDFHSIFIPTMKVNGAPKQPDYKLPSKYLPLCSAEQRY